MPNYKIHKDTGFTVGAITAVIHNILYQLELQNSNPFYSFNFGQLLVTGLFGGAVGAVGGILPDCFEPATHPNHRKVFHSFSTAGLILYSVIKIGQSTLQPGEKTFLYSMCSGYLSHLAHDGNTPKGLPLLLG